MATSTLEMTDLDVFDVTGDIQASENAELGTDGNSEMPTGDSAGSGEFGESQSPETQADGSTHSSLDEDRRIAAAQVSEQISRLMPRIRQARVNLVLAKEDAKHAKDYLEGLQDDLERLANDLTNIQSGEWQRTLPFTQEATEADSPVPSSSPIEPQEDIGASHPISALGLSDKETELLESADLATVGSLEKAMRENAWWYREIKGFGPSKVDKLMDKLMDFRKQFPVPADVRDEQEDITD